MINYLFIMPEIFITIIISVVILVDIFLPKKHRIFSYYFIQVSLLTCIYMIYYNLNFLQLSDSQIYDTGIFSNIFKLFVLVSLVLIFYYTSNFLKFFDLYKSEYFIISLFALLGMMIIISSEHFLLLYLGIELTSLSLYSIIAFNKNSIFSSEAAVKYYILGAISSGFLLFGISLIYGLTGSLFYHEIHQQISSLDLTVSQENIKIIGFIFALTFIFISLAFKFGAAPFHMWIPDVYHGSLITTTLFLSTIPKIAIFIVFIKLLSVVFSVLAIFWSDMIIILGVLSILIGNIVAISQINIKRMLAYSTIANIGFILLAISVGTPESFKSAMFYTLAYVITTIAAFGLLSQLICNNEPLEDIKSLNGLNQTHPIISFLLMTILLSYIGIPPFIGFHAKLFVIQSLVESNNFILAIFVVLMTVVGSYYYLRVIKVMYFDDTDSKVKLTSPLYVSTIFIFILILFGIFPDLFGQLSEYSISNLFNT